MTQTIAVAQPDQHSKRKWLVLVAMVFGLFMPMLDNLVVNVALPTMQRSLHAGVSDLQWIIDAYTLTFASFMLTGGSLGDIFGRKKFFMGGLVLFTLASLACGLSQSTDQLIAFRAVQGLGAALLLPGSLSILTSTFKGKELGTAIGVWAAMSGLAIAVGPLVGGYLVEHHNWQSIFFINQPVGLIGLILTAVVVKDSRDTTGTRRLDPPGLLTGTAGVFFLVYALIEGGVRGWTDQRILGAFGLAALLLIAFIIIENRRKSPMLPLSFYRIPTFAASQVVAASVFFALFGTTFFLALYLQNVRGFTPLQTGVRLFPFTVAILIVSPISGRLSDRYGSRWLMTIGTLFAATGMALLLRTQPDSSYLTIILPAFIVLGSGMALTMAPMTAAVMGSVEVRHAGVASAATNTTRELGGVLGIALLGAVVSQTFRSKLQSNLVKGGFPLQTAKTIVHDAAANAAAGGGSASTLRSQVPPGTSDAVIRQIAAAAQNSFVQAIHSGMYIAIGFMLLASLVAVSFVRSHVANRRPAERRDSRAAPQPAPAAAAPSRSAAGPDRASNGQRTLPELDGLRNLLFELPFRAGSGEVQENLTEMARATLSYYEYGVTHSQEAEDLPVGVTDDARTSVRGDVAAVAGYIALEQRFGRLNSSISADHAAALLMGALASQALAYEAASMNSEHGQDLASSIVRILMEGIGAGDLAHQYVRGVRERA